MSIYLARDGGKPSFLASNLGWSEFGDWVDSLDAGEYAEVVHLWEHGWCQEPGSLSSQLGKALSEEIPDDDVVAVVELLRDGLKDTAVVTVSDGLSATRG